MEENTLQKVDRLLQLDDHGDLPLSHELRVEIHREVQKLQFEFWSLEKKQKDLIGRLIEVSKRKKKE